MKRTGNSIIFEALSDVGCTGSGGRLNPYDQFMLKFLIPPFFLSWRLTLQCGIGRFHWVLLLACGMGLAADMAELLVLGFVLPSAEVDFCINKTQTRIIGRSLLWFF